MFSRIWTWMFCTIFRFQLICKMWVFVILFQVFKCNLSMGRVIMMLENEMGAISHYCCRSSHNFIFCQLNGIRLTSEISLHGWWSSRNTSLPWLFCSVNFWFRLSFNSKPRIIISNHRVEVFFLCRTIIKKMDLCDLKLMAILFVCFSLDLRVSRHLVED